MKFKISIFLISLILFTGCGDDEDSISNDIDFFSNHAGSVWVTPDLWWLRINNDSSDEYYDGKCVNFPIADGIYNGWEEGSQINQTFIRNEANFVSWQLVCIEGNCITGTLSFSVNAAGNKLTYNNTYGDEYVFTKVNDTFPGTDCKN